jgi:hypothetical protein
MAQEQRDAYGGLVKALFLPDAVVAGHLTVVTGVDDDCVVRHRRQQPTDLVVEVTDQSPVANRRLAQLGLGQRLVVAETVPQQRDHRMLVIGSCWQLDVGRIVESAIRRRCHQGEVRMHVSDIQQERLRSRISQEVQCSIGRRDIVPGVDVVAGAVFGHV